MVTPLSCGSFAFVLGWLLAGGLGLPLPEDLALLASGALVGRGAIGPVLAFVLVVAGVLGGDLALFLIARRLGPRLYEGKRFRRLLTPERRVRFERWYLRRGGLMVFAARHVAGVRAATFALAGAHGMALPRFVFWDGLATLLSVPVVMLLGYYGAAHLGQVRAALAGVEHAVAAVVVAGVGGWVVWTRWRRRTRVEVGGSESPTTHLGLDRPHERA